MPDDSGQLSLDDLKQSAISEEALSELTGRKVSWLRAKAIHGDIPKPSRGVYSSAFDAIAQLFKFYSTAERKDFNAARTRTETLRGNLLEIEERRRRGELAETKRVHEVWNALTISICTKLDAMVTRFPTEEMRKIAREEVRLAKIECAKPLDYKTQSVEPLVQSILDSKEEIKEAP